MIVNGIYLHFIIIYLHIDWLPLICSRVPPSVVIFYLVNFMLYKITNDNLPLRLLHLR